MTDTLTLDCGHAPNAHGPHTSGTAHTPDGREICTDCADVEQREDMATHRDVFAYVSSDGWKITTWTGGHLANVMSHKVETRYTPTGGYYVRHYYWARENGRDWYGIGAGPGVYVRLRRTK